MRRKREGERRRCDRSASVATLDRERRLYALHLGRGRTRPLSAESSRHALGSLLRGKLSHVAVFDALFSLIFIYRPPKFLPLRHHLPQRTVLHTNLLLVGCGRPAPFGLGAAPPPKLECLTKRRSFSATSLPARLVTAGYDWLRQGPSLGPAPSRSDCHPFEHVTERTARECRTCPSRGTPLREPPLRGHRRLEASPSAGTSPPGRLLFFFLPRPPFQRSLY